MHRIARALLGRRPTIQCVRLLTPSTFQDTGKALKTERKNGELTAPLGAANMSELPRKSATRGARESASSSALIQGAVRGWMSATAGSVLCARSSPAVAALRTGPASLVKPAPFDMSRSCGRFT